MYRELYLFFSSTVEKQLVVVQNIEDREMEDSTESGDQTPNVPMQLEDGVPKENLDGRSRDFSESEVARHQSFTFNNALPTRQVGYESLGQSQFFKEAPNCGLKSMPQTSEDMGLYDDDMIDGDDLSQSNIQNQQSGSSDKEPVKGRDIFIEGFFLALKKMLGHRLSHKRKEARARLCVCDTLAWIWCNPHLRGSGQFLAKNKKALLLGNR